jgi:hypothetical protein
MRGRALSRHQGQPKAHFASKWRKNCSIAGQYKVAEDLPRPVMGEVVHVISPSGDELNITRL